MARIFSQGGKPLSISADDALWLARAVEAEGEPRPEVAQVLVNRWAWLEETQPGTYPTLRSLVRAYAQPVNPKWFVGGELLVPYMNKHAALGRAWAANELEKAWKREHVHSVRQEFTPRTRQAVQQALYGPLSIMRGMLHFGPVEGVEGRNVLRIDPSTPVLYQPSAQGGMQHALSPLLHGRPHAAIGFMLLAGGGMFAWTMAHRKRRR